MACLGSAPAVGEYAFEGADNVVIYRPAGSTGWGATLAGRPVLTRGVLTVATVAGAAFSGVPARFGFTINGTSNLIVVVEASTDLGAAVWVPVSTNTIGTATAVFSDPDSGSGQRRFYRLRRIQP